MPLLSRPTDAPKGSVNPATRSEIPVSRGTAAMETGSAAAVETEAAATGSGSRSARK